ncbi:MAG: hypothetical protein ACRCZD_12765 [Phycicoccus sp.]
MSTIETMWSELDSPEAHAAWAWAVGGDDWAVMCRERTAAAAAYTSAADASAAYTSTAAAESAAAAAAAVAYAAAAAAYAAAESSAAVRSCRMMIQLHQKATR